MVTLKCNLLLLDRNTRFILWQVKMSVILMQMDFEEDYALSATKGINSYVKPFIRHHFVHELIVCDNIVSTHV